MPAMRGKEEIIDERGDRAVVRAASGEEFKYRVTSPFPPRSPLHAEAGLDGPCPARQDLMSAGIALFSAASSSCIILPFFMREPLTLCSTKPTVNATRHLNDARARHRRKLEVQGHVQAAESALRELREVDLLRDGREFLEIREVARRQPARSADRPELRRHTIREQFLLLLFEIRSPTASVPADGPASNSGLSAISLV